MLERPYTIHTNSIIIYRPTAKVALITKRIEKLLIDNELDEVTLPTNTMLGGLEAIRLTLDKEGYGILLVHWKPNFNISTQSDPFCSSLILRYNTLNKLFNIVKSIIDNKTKA